MNLFHSTLFYLRKYFFHLLSHWRILSGLVVLLLMVTLTWFAYKDAQAKYMDQLSVVIYDRYAVPLSIKENNRGHYTEKVKVLPEDFKKVLIQKEDRFFYYHPGINPFSTARALISYIKNGDAGGASTITQQLAKNLLGTETKRTLGNKLIETFYAVSLEIFTSKETILHMYANTVYLGNQVQGFGTASYAYFDTPLENTTHSQQLALLATLSYPSSRNPWEEDNVLFSESLNSRITPRETFIPPSTTDGYSFQSDTYFELRTAGITCVDTCTTTVDDDLVRSIRSILARHIEAGWNDNVRNGAVIVIDTSNSALLAMVGSKNPNDASLGNQINMAIEPRPIGSTVKPFIYAKGFMEGLRPYSLVEDREYKYPVATGFSIYPKNYDGQYHGEMTLHKALSNSLNVPSVKVLEYIGLENFYAFLSDQMKFQPVQDYDSYQYGIALGGLEMDLLTLSHYFTLFPEKGILKPLKVLQNSDENFNLPPQSSITEKTTVAEETSVELVHAIISDRLTGVNQFGLESNLNLQTTEYAVKTGTSRDFHDSWVIGYTPDFVVGVWLGNSENEPLKHVSGQSGAGAIWHDVMEHLLATPYNHNQHFTPSHITRFPINSSDEWGVRGDVIEEHQNLLLTDNLILSLHEGDTFELTDTVAIPLNARTTVTWSINGEVLSTAKETYFNPHEKGTYFISAYDSVTGKKESLSFTVTLPE